MEQSEGNCLRSWEPGGQRQQLLGVPPLFFLNLVHLLAFLLCRLFWAPSPFQQGGAWDCGVGEAGRGEAGSQHPGKRFLMHGSGRLSDPTLLESISRVAGAVDSRSPEPQAAAGKK